MKVKRIYKGNDGGKEWVKVVFENGQWWLPKLDELAEIIRLIYEVEDNKYQRGKGGEMVREFLNESLNGVPIIELAKKYMIPNLSKEDKFGPQKWNES